MKTTVYYRRYMHFVTPYDFFVCLHSTVGDDLWPHSREGSEKPITKGFPVLTLNLNLIGRFGTPGLTERYRTFISSLSCRIASVTSYLSENEAENLQMASSILVKFLTLKLTKKLLVTHRVRLITALEKIFYYMLPHDMNLSIKSGSVGYNNKILVSGEKF